MTINKINKINSLHTLDVRRNVVNISDVLGQLQVFH